jgi:hypothetical protein
LILHSLSEKSGQAQASLFAVMAVTAFLPLISNAHALMEFVRATSNY